MTLDATSALRVQLLANGYKILPNRGKIPALAGWNTPEYVIKELMDGPKGTAAKRVASWAKRFPDAPSTGLLVVSGLVVIDLDIDDVLIDAVMGAIGRIALKVFSYAPTRFGSGYKLALFCRLSATDEPFVRIASRRYNGHCVEVFGSGTRKGKATRQFGIYGPHSFNEDGSVAVEYGWHDDMPDLAHTPVEELPVITVSEIHEIIDAFEKLALDAGWQVEAQPDAEQGEAVYDITDETRFDTDRAGTGLTYDELSAALDNHSELRCSSSFMPGREGKDTSRCWVFHSPRHDCAAVFVYGDEQTHYPQDYAQADKPDDDAPIVLGPDVGPPAALNWRERYVESGYPKASLHNARLAIEALGLVCSRDTFHNTLWLGRSAAASPAEPVLPFVGEVTDANIGLLRVCLSDTYGLDFTEKHTRDAVVTLCEENRFDPVCDMLAEAQASWDGKPRLDRMAVDYFNAENTPLNRQMVRKTMIAAVARARQPGIKFDTILTMESPEGFNKSSAWALLAGEGNFSDASILGHNGREVQEQLAGIWIHENPELAGMKKAEAEVIKAFASRQVDRARPAYGHFLVAQPRHSIEVGTTNSDSYLQSSTGNRRFWPIRVERSIDLKKLKRDRLQLWGEAATLQAKGEALTLDEALWAAAAIEQEARRVQHPWEAQLAKMIVVPTSPEGVPGGRQGYMVLTREADGELRVHTRDIFEHVLKLPNVQMNRGHSMALLEAMKLQGWTHKGSIRIEGRVGPGYSKEKGIGV
jgi:hypothetical protein